jgi:hypothetical protein
VTLPKSSAVATGAPTWESITQLRVATTSTAGGAGTVDFDSIRIEDTDTLNPDYVLVAREVLTTPYVKENGKIQDVEFTIDISI